MPFAIELAPRFIRIGNIQACIPSWPVESPSGKLFEVARHPSSCGATEYEVFAFGRSLQVVWGGKASDMTPAETLAAFDRVCGGRAIEGREH